MVAPVGDSTLTFPELAGPQLVIGKTIGSRYEVLERVAGGGGGNVYRALDRQSGQVVAIKALAAPLFSARIEREIGALRIARTPGVVSLLDQGTENGVPYIVMEFVAGTAFPGRLAVGLWNELEPAALALLETLGRVHALGIVHRDLKPANVLVTDEARPVILDFGLSWGPELGERITGAYAVGTLHYLAPEQTGSRPVDARTDLYALGVMLYEALTGSLPFTGETLDGVIKAKLSARPRPIREVAPEVPRHVAETIERLITPRPEERPANAAQVFRMLRGEPGQRDLFKLPWIGPLDAIEALERAATESRSLDLIGPHGTGRTRCFLEIADRVRASGRDVLWTVAGRGPFASLNTFVRRHDLRGLTLVNAKERVREELICALKRGLVVLADDAEQLDPWSGEILAVARVAGTVLRAYVQDTGVPAVHLVPVSETSLRALFRGPDRLLHLREDAAHELYLRTGGLPGRVALELEAWIRAGLVTQSGGSFDVDRSAIDRLRAGLTSSTVGLRLDLPTPDLSTFDETLLAWVQLTQPHATIDRLARVSQIERWQLEASLASLVELGVVRRCADGAFEPLVSVSALQTWPHEERTRAHAAIAATLEPGVSARLLHLIAAGEPEDIKREALAVARRATHEGRLGEAFIALKEGLIAVRNRAAHEWETELLAETVRVAFSIATRDALQRALADLSNAIKPDLGIQHLSALVRAGLLTLSGDGPAALEIAESLPEFGSSNLELWRAGVRIMAVEDCSLEQAEATLCEIERQFRDDHDEQTRARLASWRGLLLYRRGAFEEAADLHELAARAKANPLAARTVSLLKAASAAVEACLLERATSLAAEGRELAKSIRHPQHEVRAEWVLRTAAYRGQLAKTVDHELVDALRGGPLFHSRMAALIFLNEAAIAWRAGALEQAIEYALLAEEAEQSALSPWLQQLAFALAFACGVRRPGTPPETLFENSKACPLPRIRAQTWGLLARAGAVPAPDREWLAVIGPREHFYARREVLSMAECLATEFAR
ncbi:MAG: protein kinase domain-containing protein [Planctomycetota bacterium]